VANAFVDGLAQQRQAQGLAATSVNWGPWGEGGLAGEALIQARLARRGLMALKSDRAHRALEQLLAAGVSGVVLDADWQRMSKYLGDLRPPLLSTLLAPSVLQGENALIQRLRVTPSAAREAVLIEHLQRELQQILGLAEPPAPDRGFFELGMDSLMAVELRNRLQTQLGEGFQLSNTLPFDHPTIERLAQHLADRLGVVGENKNERPEGTNRCGYAELQNDMQRLKQATHGEVVDELSKLLGIGDIDVLK
jgi:hypothetical protein